MYIQCLYCARRPALFLLNHVIADMPKETLLMSEPLPRHLPPNPVSRLTILTTFDCGVRETCAVFFDRLFLYFS